MTVQVLKVIRYTSKLVLVTSLADSKSGAAKGLQRFEASVGTSRSATQLISVADKHMSRCNQRPAPPCLCAVCSCTMVAVYTGWYCAGRPIGLGNGWQT